MDKIVKIKKRNINLLTDRWIWWLAWKDARHNIPRLLLLISTIVTGIATLVAVSSFNQNLKQDIDEQAKALLGADVVLYHDSPFEGKMEGFFDSLHNDRAQDVRFSSMAVFPQKEDSRISQVVGIKGPYPFYGGMEATPDSAMAAFRQGKGALIDEGLAYELKVGSGDSVKLGELSLPVLGLVTKMPGNVKIIGNMAPSVYIPYDSVGSTSLLTKGSRANYRMYLKTTPPESPEYLLDKLKPLINRFGLGYETVEYRKESLGNSFENLYRFLNLLGYIALMLGALGVASSVHVYTSEKKGTVALLRCLGLPGRAPFLVFLLQLSVLGLVGSILGAVLGSAIQLLIPYALSDFLPLQLNFSISWPAVSLGVGAGVVLTVLFSLLPLVRIRHLPPMAVLQTVVPTYRKHLKTTVFLIVVILGFNWFLAVQQTQDPTIGSFFFLSFLAALLIFGIFAGLLRWLLKHAWLKRIGFVWRQSISNLYRPKNQTLILLIVIGFGAFLIATVSMVQHGILTQIAKIGKRTRANMVIFDVQPDQKEDVEYLIDSLDVERQEIIPVIIMRLNKIREESLEEGKSDSLANVPNWLLYMEHLATYRSHLLESETLLEGELQEKAQKGDTVRISVTENMAEQLRLHIGDQVVFNLQGVALTTYIGSIRKVDWQQVQTNFAFVFPEGVLEEAPQFYAMLLKASSKVQAANLKNQLLEAFPNVSTVDLALVIKTVGEVLDRLAFAIRFMAMFSILTGVMVLIGSLSNSKFAKIKENALLRTLGASRKQVLLISLLEYSYLGLLASLIGIGLSLVGAWGLSDYFLGIVLVPNVGQLVLVGLFILLLTLGTSWFNLRTISDRPPSEVLRKEN